MSGGDGKDASATRERVWRVGGRVELSTGSKTQSRSDRDSGGDGGGIRVMVGRVGELEK